MRAPSWHNCPESYPAEQHLHARGEEPFSCTPLQFTTKWEWGGQGRGGGHLNQWCKPEHCHADRVTWLMHWPVGRRDERKEVDDERETIDSTKNQAEEKQAVLSYETRSLLCSVDPRLKIFHSWRAVECSEGKGREWGPHWWPDQGERWK